MNNHDRERLNIDKTLFLNEKLPGFFDHDEEMSRLERLHHGLIPREEEDTLRRSLEALRVFNGWVDTVATQESVQRMPFDSEIRLRQLAYDRGKGELEEPFFLAPAALPLLEAVSQTAHLAFREWADSRLAENNPRAMFSRQICVGLCHLLSLIQKMGEGQINWPNPRWEPTTDGFFVCTMALHQHNQVLKVYYTPVRKRFALIWQEGNPRGLTEYPNPTVVEVRCDPGKTDGNQSRFEVDISVKLLALERNNRGVSTTVGATELLDLVFGPNRHHIRIGQGPYDECVNLVQDTMRFLGVSHLIKTVEDIPRKGRTKR